MLSGSSIRGTDRMVAGPASTTSASGLPRCAPRSACAGAPAKSAVMSAATLSAAPCRRVRVWKAAKPPATPKEGRSDPGVPSRSWGLSRGNGGHVRRCRAACGGAPGSGGQYRRGTAVGAGTATQGGIRTSFRQGCDSTGAEIFSPRAQKTPLPAPRRARLTPDAVVCRPFDAVCRPLRGARR